MCFFNWRHIEFILLYVDCRTKTVCSHAHTCPSALRLKSWFQTFYLHVVSSSRSNIHHRNIPHGAQTHASVSPKILLVFLSGVSQIKKKNPPYCKHDTSSGGEQLNPRVCMWTTLTCKRKQKKTLPGRRRKKGKNYASLIRHQWCRKCVIRGWRWRRRRTSELVWIGRSEVLISVESIERLRCDSTV